MGPETTQNEFIHTKECLSIRQVWENDVEAYLKVGIEPSELPEEPECICVYLQELLERDV